MFSKDIPVQIQYATLRHVNKLYIFFFNLKKHRSDTESAEDTTPKEDETDNKEDSEDKKDENKKSAASGMVSRVSNIFAAMKKSVQKPKESKYSAETPESEMKVSLFLKQKNSKNEL